VAFEVLVVEVSFVGLAVDGLASNELWDLPHFPNFWLIV
jgi:hypothetical protein